MRCVTAWISVGDEDLKPMREVLGHGGLSYGLLSVCLSVCQWVSGGLSYGLLSVCLDSTFRPSLLSGVYNAVFLRIV